MTRRFQFSLRALLLTVVAVCLSLGLMFHVSPRTYARAIVVVVPVSAAFVFVGLSFGSSGTRAFCIGAAVPLTMMLIFMAMHIESWLANLFSAGFNAKLGGIATRGDNILSQRALCGALLASIALGYLCVVFRRFVEPQD